MLQNAGGLVGIRCNPAASAWPASESAGGVEVSGGCEYTQSLCVQADVGSSIRGRIERRIKDNIVVVTSKCPTPPPLSRRQSPSFCIW